MTSTCAESCPGLIMSKTENNRQGRLTRLRHSQSALAYLFVSPWVIGFLVFGVYPFAASIYYSLCQYDVLRVPKFIGLRNYRDLLLNDPYFWKAIYNTLFYTVLRVPLNIAGSLLLAVLVNQSVRGIRLFRTAYFLPSVVSGVAISAIWMWIFNPQYGILNALLEMVGVQGPSWLGSTTWAKPALVLMSLWSIGGGRMLVFLAALQGIPTQLYESVAIDGGDVTAVHPCDPAAHLAGALSVAYHRNHVFLPNLHRSVCDDSGRAAELDPVLQPVPLH